MNLQTAAFEAAFLKLLGIEGDYSDDPADSGGKTRYGITESVARNHGYNGEINALPTSVAKEIYHRMYWRRVNADSLFSVDAELADRVFDFAVNAGPHRACETLQKILNLLNRGETDYRDIDVDGVIGGQTLHALNSYATKRGKRGLLLLLMTYAAHQIEHYTSLAERRPKDERFVYGQIDKRVLEPAIALARRMLANA